MAEIREKTDTDDIAGIVAVATEELRRVYRRAPTANLSDILKSEQEVTLVAVEREVIVGVADYSSKEDSLYVKGLAIHPENRCHGIAKALVRQIEEIAALAGKPKVTLSTIMETGNPKIFEQLGFTVTDETVAIGFEGLGGQPVTKVDMVRMVSQHSRNPRRPGESRPPFATLGLNPLPRL